MYKHITTIALLATIALPTAAFAQQSTKAAKPAAAPKELTEAQRHKNRMERVNNAINAADGNVAALERAIGKALMRAQEISSAGGNTATIDAEIKQVNDKLAEAKTVIASARELAKKLDTKNPEQVKQIQDKIKLARDKAHEAVALAKAAIKTLRTIKTQPIRAEAPAAAKAQ